MKKTFTITCEMEERWVDHFMSMLHMMQSYGDLGHSGILGFYSDGDGDFRPKFDTDIKWSEVEPFKPNDRPTLSGMEYLYDAG